MSISQPPMVLVIEPDTVAAFEIAEWLADRPERPEVMLSTSVEAAEKCLRTEMLDWLFIRIRCWDEFQRQAGTFAQLFRRVIFLSGREERGTGSLQQVLDAHLQPPYRADRLATIWERLSRPGYQPKPIDFFFLRTHGRFVPVR